MGSCISKCKPKKQEIDEEEDHVNLQDKLVIIASENPPLKPQSPQKTQNPNSFLNPISPSPSHSSCSSSSFSYSTNCYNSSSSSSSSNQSLSSASSSSSSITKHKSSFSNEFSKSRLKQNPQIVLLDPNKSTAAPVSGPTQKRPRASSPNLTRQKSFRRDPVGPTLISANKPSSLRSRSPSRRFISNGTPQNCKRMVNNASFRKNTNINCLSDVNSRSRRSIRSPSMRKEAEICSLNRVVSCVDGITIGEERKLGILQDVEMLPVEDLNNPLIALDCFIFL